MKQSTETWTFRYWEKDHITEISSGDQKLFIVDFSIFKHSAERMEDVARFVAAVNTVRGIPTEMLEDGSVGELLEASKQMAQEFYCRMNPAQMPTVAKRAFDLWTRIEEAKAK